MTNFSLILNPALQAFAMSSPAILSLSEEEQQSMVSRFVAATPEEQAAYIAIFDQEKVNVATIEARQAQELAGAASSVDQAMDDLRKAQHQYDTVVRQTLESKSLAEDEQRANDILKQLESI